MRRWLASCFTLFLVIGEFADGAELYESPRSVKALSMGGVYLPWVKESDAVLWNPALMGEISSLTWEAVDIGLAANGADVYELYQQMQDSGCSGAACYDSFYGKPLHVSAHGKTSFVMPHWGATAFTSGMLEGTLHNPAFPTFNLTFIKDYGFATGMGFSLLPGLSAGVTLKRTYRQGGNQDVSLSTLTSGNTALLDDFDQRGVGYGFDASVMLRSPEGTPFRLTTVLHWQDIGSTAFLPEGNSTGPDRIKDNLSFGFGGEMDLPGFDLQTGIEYRHITTQGEQFGKKLHLGTELSLPLIDVRFGLNQGYPTFGTGIDLFIFDLDLASYTEETGVYPGQSPSQRFKMSLSLDFSIDADFSLTTKEGRRRKLKQRR